MGSSNTPYLNMYPKLKYLTFSGKDSEKDKCAFKSFLSQFENCVLGVGSKAVKQYYALQIIQHLTIMKLTVMQLSSY